MNVSHIQAKIAPSTSRIFKGSRKPLTYSVCCICQRLRAVSQQDGCSFCCPYEKPGLGSNFQSRFQDIFVCFWGPYLAVQKSLPAGPGNVCGAGVKPSSATCKASCPPPGTVSLAAVPGFSRNKEQRSCLDNSELILKVISPSPGVGRLSCRLHLQLPKAFCFSSCILSFPKSEDSLYAHTSFT